MNHEPWLERLYWLAERCSQWGVYPDLAALSLADLWGLYCFLSRIADGS